MKVLHEEKLLRYEIISMPVEEKKTENKIFVVYSICKIANFVLEARS